jgi:hypothetical protein
MSASKKFSARQPPPTTKMRAGLEYFPVWLEKTELNRYLIHVSKYIRSPHSSLGHGRVTSRPRWQHRRPSMAVEELAQLNRVNDELPFFKAKQCRSYRFAFGWPIQFPPNLLHSRDTPAPDGH